MDDTVICTEIEEVQSSLADVLREVEKTEHEDARDYILAAIHSLNLAINSIEAASD